MLVRTAATALLAAAVALPSAAAHNIVLPAHGLECYYENLHKDDTMTVTFQVGDREFGSAGNLDIDFWVRADRRDGGKDKREQSVSAVGAPACLCAQVHAHPVIFSLYSI